MNNFFPNFLIGLREGLEASLVVSILAAYLIKTNRKSALRFVWFGAAGAVAVSAGVVLFLNLTMQALTFQAQEILGGVMSLIAVAFVTYMIFWMRRTARAMKAHLEAQMDNAFSMGALAISAMTFLAVGREGIETAIFLWSTTQATGGSQVGPVLGALLGIGSAALLAYLLYRRAIHLNLATFFKWTGVGLILVAAGVAAYGVHDLQEAAVLPGINQLAFDFSEQLSPTSWYATIVGAVFNVTPAMTVLSCLAWLAYVAIVMPLYLRPSRPRAAMATSQPKVQA